MLFTFEMMGWTAAYIRTSTFLSQQMPVKAGRWYIESVGGEKDVCSQLQQWFIDHLRLWVLLRFENELPSLWSFWDKARHFMAHPCVMIGRWMQPESESTYLLKYTHTRTLTAHHYQPPPSPFLFTLHNSPQVWCVQYQYLHKAAKVTAAC